MAQRAKNRNKPRLNERKRVLVAQVWWENRIFRGIAEYAKKQGWILDCSMQWNQQSVPSNWKGDGVIAFTAGYTALEDFIRERNVPVVDLENYHDRMPWAPKVTGDDRELGAMAARHFISLGFRHLLFVSKGGVRGATMKNRREGFYEQAAEKGISCQDMDLSILAKHLQELPIPMGVFTASDYSALDVIRLAIDKGLSVPAEVAVLGVDDSEVVCECAEVPLSSINCAFEKKGWVAAELLDRMMAGDPPPVDAVVVPPSYVTVRDSTNTIALPHVGAAKVLQHIRTYFREPLRLVQVCREQGQLLRTVQAVFKEHVGNTLQEELIRCRLKAAEALMRENPKAKVESIAHDSGFGNRINLTRAFLKHRGMSPGKYCRKHCLSTLSDFAWQAPKPDFKEG